MAELNGLKRWFWRIGIVVGIITIFGFVSSKIFVTRDDFNSHVVWGQQRNEILIELVKNQKMMIDSMSVVIRKLDKIDNKLENY